MPNKHHSKMKSHGGGSNKAMGAAPDLSMPMKPGPCAGIPGSPQPSNRSGGAPTTGRKGAPFYVKKIGL